MAAKRSNPLLDPEQLTTALAAFQHGDASHLYDLLEDLRSHSTTVLRRGHKAATITELGGRLREGSLSKAIGRPPKLVAKATSEQDGRLVRLVLLRLADSQDRPACGIDVALVDPDSGGHLVDRTRTDRRGLALLRLPPAAKSGTVAQLPVKKTNLRVAGRDPLEVVVPKGSQFTVQQLEPPEGVQGEQGELRLALEALKAATDVLNNLGDVDNTSDSAGPSLAEATGNLQTATAALEAAVNGAADTLQAATQAAEAAAAALGAAEAFTAANTEMATSIAELVAALTAAVTTIASAVTQLAEQIPDDSVLSRLPVSFSPDAADAITRLLEVAEGPIPGLGPSVRAISTSRTPLIKQMSVLRVVPGPEGKPARRFLVRLRQEWTFIGYTLGRLVRVDSLDPGTAVGTIDARAAARADVFSTLDATTASALKARLDAKLSAHASVDTVLDVAARADLDARLKAAARVGVRRDPEEITIDDIGDFVANLGDNVLDALLPDVGADLDTNLDATVDVDSHAEFSLDSSLLASARLNAAATLTNKATVAVSAALGVTASISARATASVNPSLARAVNLLRFELIENYAVASAVEDVLEIEEEPIFDLQLPEDLFPPADVVEYRRLFQPRLLDRTLRRHFDVLSRALAAIRRGGDPIEQVRIRVEYAAAPLGGAGLHVTIAGRTKTLNLRPSNGVTETVLHLGGPRAPEEVSEVRLGLVTTPSITSFFNPTSSMTDTEISRIELRYRVGDSPDVVFDAASPGTAPIAVSGDNPAMVRTISISPPELQLELETDPLVEHIKRNRHHYLGVLAEAALRRPALRQDSPQLADVDPDLWKLPLLGFEGNIALLLVTSDADENTVKDLIDDEGTATIVQLAAAGLYTEAAQGSLAITDAIGKLHPALASAFPQMDLSAIGPIISALAEQAAKGPSLPSVPGATLPESGGLPMSLGG